MNYPDWKIPTPKEQQLDTALLNRAEGKVKELLHELLWDEEVNLYHSYANAVSVRRLGYNDHGPVHARITTYNALKILRLMHEAGVMTSLESDEIGTFEDSAVATVLGCFLHDVGMAVTRDEHEWHSVTLVDGIIQRYLDKLYPDDLGLRIVLRSLTHEVIIGHMAHTRIHSVEAGVVLVADGTDMSRGRSRIPLNMARDPMVGDMHRYSANSITRVEIGPGDQKPVKICIHMDDVTGLFQVEEVLMTKVKASPIISHMEIVAMVTGQDPKYYLK
ncbi:MAG: phosphohydrolase [Bacteroidetes bacterium]|nr:phosphohydrolase [Bacteroidota bacterium]